MPNKPHIKKIPMRKCVGCGEMKPKKELVRIVKSPDGDVSLDLTGKKAGRGAYLCQNLGCLKKARKQRSVERAFETQIADEIYQRMEAEMSGDG